MECGGRDVSDVLWAGGSFLVVMIILGDLLRIWPSWLDHNED